MATDLMKCPSPIASPLDSAEKTNEPFIKRHDVASELLALCGQHAVDEVERAAAVEPERRRSHVLASARDLIKQVAQHGVGIKQGFHA